MAAPTNRCWGSCGKQHQPLGAETKLRKAESRERWAQSAPRLPGTKEKGQAHLEKPDAGWGGGV